MNATEARRIAHFQQHLDVAAKRAEKLAHDQKVFEEAQAKLKEDMRWWHKRIGEEASAGKESTSIASATGDGQVLQGMVIKELEREGYKCSIEYVRFDDDGNGHDVLTVSW